MAVSLYRRATRAPQSRWRPCLALEVAKSWSIFHLDCINPRSEGCKLVSISSLDLSNLLANESWISGSTELVVAALSLSLLWVVCRVLAWQKWLYFLENRVSLVQSCSHFTLISSFFCLVLHQLYLITQLPSSEIDFLGGILSLEAVHKSSRWESIQHLPH